jgi:hypothetical protein
VSRCLLGLRVKFRVGAHFIDGYLFAQEEVLVLLSNNFSLRLCFAPKLLGLMRNLAF